MKLCRRLPALCAVLSLCLSLCLSLSGCGPATADDAPEGFVLASEPETDGFALYLPDTWTVYRQGSVAAGYATSLDRSSVSATSVASLLSPRAFFEASLPDYEAAPFADFHTVSLTDGESAGRACSTALFSVSVNGASYLFRQMIVDGGEGCLFVLTCQACTDVVERLGTSRWAMHEEDYAAVCEYFRVTGTPATRPEPAPEGTAPAGMKVASYRKLLGCTLCVPESWTVTLSEGAVTAQTADGAVVGLAPIDPATSRFSEYYEGLLDGYRLLWPTLTELTPPAQAETVGGYPAYRFRLSMTVGDETYVTEQLILSKNSLFGSGAYLLTYTAPEAVYETHAAEWRQITEAFAF